MPSPAEFADEERVEAWQSRWLNAANVQGGTRYDTSITSGGVTQRPGDQWRVIGAPAVINGNVDISADHQLRLMPRSTNPQENVVYVTGNVRNLGHLVNHGVTLVVLGKYSDGPSAQYRIDHQGSPFSSQAKAVQAASFISLFKGPDAFTFTTNASSHTGLIYAANGGIRIRGANAEFRGSLIAGGRGTFGGVDIQPGGGTSFVVNYDPNASTGGNLEVQPTEPVYRWEHRSYSPFELSRPYQWQQTQ